MAFLGGLLRKTFLDELDHFVVAHCIHLCHVGHAAVEHFAGQVLDGEYLVTRQARATQCRVALSQQLSRRGVIAAFEQLQHAGVDGARRLAGELLQIESNEEMIQRAIKAVYSRPASEEEIQVMSGYLKKRPDRREEAVQQIVWALLTGSELRFNY